MPCYRCIRRITCIFQIHVCVIWVLCPEVPSHHKHPSRCGSSLTARQPFTHGLVVKRLLAVVEGVVIESVHQVGIDVTEEHPHLAKMTAAQAQPEDKRESRDRVKRCEKLTLFQSSF